MISFRDFQLDSIVNVGAGYGPDRSDEGVWAGLQNVPIKIAIEANPVRARQWLKGSWFPLEMEVHRRLPFCDKSIDAIISTDFIEHLDRSEGLDLLHDFERVARKVIMVFTPDGFLDVEKYQADLLTSAYDLHKSGYSMHDFTSLGYEVKLCESIHNFGDVHFNGIWAWKVLR